MIDHPFLTLTETAKHLRIHRMTAYELVRKRKLPGAKIGGQWRISRGLLDTLLTKRMYENVERGR